MSIYRHLPIEQLSFGLAVCSRPDKQGRNQSVVQKHLHQLTYLTKITRIKRSILTISDSTNYLDTVGVQADCYTALLLNFGLLPVLHFLINKVIN
jgi:hypothetical protein